ncbi:TniQ family protein [Bradyrhizobium symbiodeficiens]|uniref:TniQ family protein n=1 Tax=Bradyrhizobium symbiodeficiens TaxID=1404367 RepID=UPI0030CF1208
MSYASRLAACNGTRAAPFCADFGIRMLDVADGDEKSLRALAALGNVAPDLLFANAFVKSGPLQWTLHGEALDRTVLRRTRLAICPACALADIKAKPKLMPQVAIYGRATWLLDVVRRCPVHRIPVAYAEQAHGVKLLHDVAQHAKLLVPRLHKLAETPAKKPGPLQDYVLRRLAGVKGSALLDPMRVASVVRLCETAGAVALFPDLDIKQLSEDQREAAGTVGYEALASGHASFRSLLAGLKGTVHHRSRLDGPTAVFGKLYWLLSRTSEDPDLAPVRDIMREFVLENFAIESGQSVLGKPLDRRRLHSLQTLARQTSMHPKVLRRHLRAAGLVTDRQMEMSDHNVLFDADAALAVAAPLAGALSAAETMEHLNAPRSQMAVLIEHGFVRPRHRAAGAGGQDRYAASDLDAFLAKLSVKFLPARASRKFRNIPDTAKQCCRSAAEVVRLILDGRLETGKSSDVRGYLGVLVDPDQAARALRGAAIDALPLREAARSIGISDPALGALIKQGHVVTLIVPNPVNKRPQRLVPADEVARFRGQYVSLWRLAKEHKVHIAAMKAMLDRVGVAPAFEGVFARLYRTADLAGKAIGDRRRAPSPTDKRQGKTPKLSRRRKGG